MVFGLGYIRKLYAYLTRREELSRDEELDRAGVPSQSSLDQMARPFRWYRERFEAEHGRPVHHLPSVQELVCESRGTYYNYLCLERDLRRDRRKRGRT